MKRPPLGWRTHAKLLREFRQGETQSRWSERRFLILMAEYRLNCRRELVEELTECADHDQVMVAVMEEVCDHPE